MATLEHGGFAAIVLAAGQSLRFGPGNKLFAGLGDQNVLERTLSCVAALPLADSVVVTGERDTCVDEIVGRAGLRQVANLDFAEGIGCSIAVGIAAIDPRSRGVFVVLADMPFVLPQDFAALASLFSGAYDICRPVHNGQPGHPVLFGNAYLPELALLAGDIGAQTVLQRHRRQVKTLEVADARIVRDIDTRADLPGDVTAPGSPRRFSS